MIKKSKLGIMAAVSAALLLGGAVLRFKDDIAQNISENDLKPFKPIMVSQGTLDDITENLIEEKSVEAIELENSEFSEISQNFAVSDVLPNDVCQSLIDSAQSLNNAYPDAIGWLYIPDTPINYPIMHGDDNDFYLHHAFDGGNLSAGSIFLDFRCENRFMNPVNILYGHNMGNGSMFAGVLNVADSANFDGQRYA